MKKLLIGSFVGAIVLFVWSFLAWSVLPIHLNTFMYNPAMNTVLKTLADSNVETGVYAMPMADNRNVSGFDSKYREETERVMKESENKPAVMVSYLKEGYQFSALTIIKGFLINLITLFAACMLLIPGYKTMNTFFGRWWLTLFVGVLVSAAGPLINYNWMGAPWSYTIDLIMDVMVNWGITGLWLAYYFKN